MSTKTNEPERRPSSATSYGAHPRQASFSSAAASSSGVSSSGANTSINNGVINNSGINTSNGPITEATAKARRPPRPPPVHIAESIHPGMEIFSQDSGRSPDAITNSPAGRGYLSPTPALSPYTPRDEELPIVRNFAPSTAFLVTRTGTPGIGGRTPRSALRSRGWEIRDVTQQQQQQPAPARPRRLGTGGIGGRNMAAETMLDRVTDGIFGSWGAWIDAGSQLSVSSSSTWRRSLDTPALSPTPSTLSFFSHFRDRSLQIVPTIQQPQAADSTASLPPLPPDPTYVSLKPHPASSKSTFYSIETTPLTSNSHSLTPTAEAYPTETGRIPISQWKVPYSVHTPSIITLLNNQDYQHNHHHHRHHASHHNHTHGNHRGSKSGTLEQHTPASSVRSQFFVMDKSTYIWEYKTRPKMRVPIGLHNQIANSGNNPSVAIGRASSVSSGGSRFPGQAYGDGHNYPLSAPSNQTTFTPAHANPSSGAYSLYNGTGLGRTPSTKLFPSLSLPKRNFKQKSTTPESKTVKFRSEVLVLFKETADGFRYVVGEYHFLKCVKTTHATSRMYTPSPTPSRLRNILSPHTTSSAPSTPTQSNESKSVQHTPLGNHQAGILLIDHRSVNTIIAINSLLITLKRERQRKLITLGMSNRGITTRKGWGYGVSQSPVHFSAGSEVDVGAEDEVMESGVGGRGGGGGWRGDAVDGGINGLGIAQQADVEGKGGAVASMVNKHIAAHTLENGHDEHDNGESAAGLDDENGNWDHIGRYSLGTDDWVWNGDGWVKKVPGVSAVG